MYLGKEEYVKRQGLEYYVDLDRGNIINILILKYFYKIFDRFLLKG